MACVVFQAPAHEDARGLEEAATNAALVLPEALLDIEYQRTPPYPDGASQLCISCLRQEKCTQHVAHVAIPVRCPAHSLLIHAHRITMHRNTIVPLTQYK